MPTNIDLTQLNLSNIVGSSDFGSYMNANTIAVTSVSGNITMNASVINVISADGNSSYINGTAIVVGNSTSNVVFKWPPTLSSLTLSGNTLTNFTEVVNVQSFTSSGNWVKPSWATDGSELVLVHLWGGGGGGSTYGGGGGAFVYGVYMANQLGSTVSVYVGTGGSAGVSGANAANGGQTTFGYDVNQDPTKVLVAHGGKGGNSTAGGSGGGWFASSGPLAGSTSSIDSTFGGGAGRDQATTTGPGTSIYGGGGGGITGTAGGNSVFGGAGGTAGGVSVYGGNSGLVPAGGGAPSTAGASGKAIIYTLRKLA